MKDGRAVPSSTSPVVGSSSPATRLSSVDLPHPDAPSRQTNSPGWTCRSMSRSAVTASGPVPKVLPTSRSISAGAGAAGVGASTVEVIRVTPVPCRGRRRRPPAGLLREHVVQRGHVDEPLEVRLLVRDPGGDAVLGELRERRRERVEAERQLGERPVEHRGRQRGVRELLDRVVRDGLGLGRVRGREVDRLLLAAQQRLDGLRVLLQELGADDQHGGRELAVRPQGLLVDEHLRARVDQPRAPRLGQPAARELPGLEQVERARVVEVLDGDLVRAGAVARGCSP